jgi:hypothetical protein
VEQIPSYIGARVIRSVLSTRAGFMDPLWKRAIQQNRCQIMDAADTDDVVLNRCIDFLISKEICLQPERIEGIKKLNNSRQRMGKLLDCLLARGRDPSTFHVFCGALKYAQCEELVKTLQQSYDNLMQGGIEYDYDSTSCFVPIHSSLCF